ncbi:Uncharacterised protein [uncultured archaeon]|nr:Uncharacterised protein [uncultured archaeon]
MELDKATKERLIGQYAVFYINSQRDSRDAARFRKTCKDEFCLNGEETRSLANKVADAIFNKRGRKGDERYHLLAMLCSEFGTPDQLEAAIKLAVRDAGHVECSEISFHSASWLVAKYGMAERLKGMPQMKKLAKDYLERCPKIHDFQTEGEAPIAFEFAKAGLLDKKVADEICTMAVNGKLKDGEYGEALELSQKFGLEAMAKEIAWLRGILES